MKHFYPFDFQSIPNANFVLERLPAAPSNPVPGRRYFNTTVNAEYVWNGGAWRPTDASFLHDKSISLDALEKDPTQRQYHQGTQAASTIIDLAQVVKAYTLDSFAAPAANLNVNNFQLKGVAQATLDTDVANWGQIKTWVTAAINGQKAFKNPVRVAVTTNIALTGTPVYDGVQLAAGDRVLRTYGTDPANGIYVIPAGGGAWTFDSDANQTGQLIEGTEVLVTEGTALGGGIFRVTTSGQIVPGTTPLTWVQVNKVNAYLADNTSLALNGFTFSVQLKAGAGLKTTSQGLALDTALSPLKFSGTITGDGTTTSFVLVHGLNSSTPDVLFYDSTGARVGIEYTVSGPNQITITFYYPPGNGTVFSVAVFA